MRSVLLRVCLLRTTLLALPDGSIAQPSRHGHLQEEELRRTLLKAITTMNMEALSIFSNAANQDVSAATPFIPPTVLKGSRAFGEAGSDGADLHPRAAPTQAPQAQYSHHPQTRQAPPPHPGVYVTRNRR